jgi:hypothetical protein
MRLRILVLFALCFYSVPAAAQMLESFKVGEWKGDAYHFPRGFFSCSMSTELRDRGKLVGEVFISISDDRVVALQFIKEDWRLPFNGDKTSRPLQLLIDKLLETTWQRSPEPQAYPFCYRQPIR